MSDFNISDLLGTPTQHHYERTDESWKYLESQIARFQYADQISLYDMWQLISNYRKSPDDNVFDVEITYKNTVLAPIEIKSLNRWITPDELVLSLNKTALRYNKVDADGSRHMYMILEQVVSVVMRGSTFYVTLKPKYTTKISARCSNECNKKNRLRHLVTKF